MNNNAEILENQSHCEDDFQNESVITLTDFINDFGSGLMQAVQDQNRAIVSSVIRFFE